MTDTAFESDPVPAGRPGPGPARRAGVPSWALAAAALVLALVVSAWTTTDRMQADLTSRARDALEPAGVVDAQVRYDGREAVVTGAKDGDRTTIRSILERIDGTSRVVFGAP